MALFPDDEPLSKRDVVRLYSVDYGLVQKDVRDPPIRIPLTGEDKYRPCRYCDHDEAVLTNRKDFASGRGYHAGGMRCVRCAKHLGWLTDGEVENFTKGR